MIRDINIHNVKSIKVSEASRNEIPNDYLGNFSSVYYTRKIVFTDDEGNEVTVTAFGSNEIDLVRGSTS